MDTTRRSPRLTPLYSRAEIGKRVAELGEQIGRDYASRDIVVVGVLKGAFIFLGDLAREMNLDARIRFVSMASYGSETESSGTPTITLPTDLPITGEDVLVVEDILDTGRSMEALLEVLKGRSPRTLRLCVCIDKRERRAAPVEADYVGFELSDGFVVGYGIDYAGQYRTLPEIFTLAIPDAET